MTMPTPLVSIPVLDNFSIVGRESNNLTRTIREAMYIRENDPSPNSNTGKYQMSLIWDDAPDFITVGRYVGCITSLVLHTLIADVTHHTTNGPICGMYYILASITFSTDLTSHVVCHVESLSVFERYSVI